MTEELWKDVQGYEGLYQVSTLGRVRSLDMKIECYPMERKPYTQLRKGRILKTFRYVNNQLVVHLYKDGESKYKLIHRLVAEAFLENPMNCKYVDFIDGDSTNFKVDNLKWVSSSTKMKKAYKKRREDNMNKVIYVDELDKKLMYYYRNNFHKNEMSEKTGVDLKIIQNRLIRLRKHGMLKRWWEEEARDTI